MSDEDYASFLDKANQDTGSNKASTQSKSASTKSVDTEVPKALQEVEEYYQSESDEPFEPVSLRWDKTELPTADQLAKLINHTSNVESQSLKDFDPRNQYKAVVDAVKKAGGGDVRVFRVAHGSTRAEYYLVSVDAKGKKVVGLKALAVES